MGLVILGGGGGGSSPHTHPESDVTSLTTDLAAKAASSHTHAESAVTNLVSDLAAKAAAAHSHAESDVTSLLTDLAAKAALTHASAHGFTGSDPLPVPLGRARLSSRYDFLNRYVGTGSTALTSGTLYLTHFTAERAFTIANLGFSSRTVTSPGTTLFRLGVWAVDGSGNLSSALCTTPNDTTLGATANTLYTKAVSAGASLVAGTDYAFGLLWLGTGTMNSASIGSAAGQVVGALQPVMFGSITGLSDLPSAFPANLVAPGASVQGLYGYAT